MKRNHNSFTFSNMTLAYPRPFWLWSIVIIPVFKNQVVKLLKTA